jgi:hypothetical protein
VHPVAAGALGHVHRGVGAAQGFLDLSTGPGCHSDAHRDRHMEIAHRLDHPLGDPGRAVDAAPDEQCAELVPAEACEYVVVTGLAG